MKQAQKTAAKSKSAVTAVKAAPLPVVVDKSRTLEMSLKPGQSEEQAISEVLTRGTVGCSSTVIDYSRMQHAGLSLTDLATALNVQGEAVNRGDLSEAERMLNGQAVALNAIFVEMARRAALNMGAHLDATDRYLRLALKAQAQSRATVEALAEMKNPHAVAFVKQANIAHGPQQVNNGASAEPKERPRDGYASEADDGSRYEGLLGRPTEHAGCEDHRKHQRACGRRASSSKHVPVVD